MTNEEKLLRAIGEIDDALVFTMSSKHPKRKISLDEVTDEKYCKFIVNSPF